MDARFSATVIISTYEQPEWLRRALIALSVQSRSDFDLVVADDGSGEETKSVIAEFTEVFGDRLRHAWHAKDGFRKNVILNEAVRQARSDYLIFIDGDVLTRSDFVDCHLRLARPGRFLSAGCLRLGWDSSRAIEREHIEAGLVSEGGWLRSVGQQMSPKFIKLVPYGPISRLLDTLTPTRATFNGMNSSVARADFMAVNGFDERMAYGGCDREFGERLVNAGIIGRQCRYSLCCVHLKHDRPYVDPKLMARNREIRDTVAADELNWTEYGIER